MPDEYLCERCFPRQLNVERAITVQLRQRALRSPSPRSHARAPLVPSFSSQSSSTTLKSPRGFPSLPSSSKQNTVTPSISVGALASSSSSSNSLFIHGSVSHSIPYSLPSEIMPTRRLSSVSVPSTPVNYPHGTIQTSAQTQSGSRRGATGKRSGGSMGVGGGATIQSIAPANASDSSTVAPLNSTRLTTTGFPLSIPPLSEPRALYLTPTSSSFPSLHHPTRLFSQTQPPINVLATPSSSHPYHNINSSKQRRTSSTAAPLLLSAALESPPPVPDFSTPEDAYDYLAASYVPTSPSDVPRHLSPDEDRLCAETVTDAEKAGIVVFGRGTNVFASESLLEDADDEYDEAEPNEDGDVNIEYPTTPPPVHSGSVSDPTGSSPSTPANPDPFAILAIPRARLMSGCHAASARPIIPITRIWAVNSEDEEGDDGAGTGTGTDEEERWARKEREITSARSAARRGKAGLPTLAASGVPIYGALRADAVRYGVFAAAPLARGEMICEIKGTVVHRIRLAAPGEVGPGGATGKTSGRKQQRGLGTGVANGSGDVSGGGPTHVLPPFVFPMPGLPLLVDCRASGDPVGRFVRADCRGLPRTFDGLPLGPANFLGGHHLERSAVVVPRPWNGTRANSVARVAVVDSQPGGRDSERLRLVLVASRNIARGEEVVLGWKCGDNGVGLWPCGCDRTDGCVVSENAVRTLGGGLWDTSRVRDDPQAKREVAQAVQSGRAARQRAVAARARELLMRSVAGSGGANSGRMGTKRGRKESVERDGTEDGDEELAKVRTGLSGCKRRKRKTGDMLDVEETEEAISTEDELRSLTVITTPTISPPRKLGDSGSLDQTPGQVFGSVMRENPQLESTADESLVDLTASASSAVESLIENRTISEHDDDVEGGRTTDGAEVKASMKNFVPDYEELAPTRQSRENFNPLESFSMAWDITAREYKTSGLPSPTNSQTIAEHPPLIVESLNPPAEPPQVTPPTVPVEPAAPVQVKKVSLAVYKLKRGSAVTDVALTNEPQALPLSVTPSSADPFNKLVDFEGISDVGSLARKDSFTSAHSIDLNATTNLHIARMAPESIPLPPQRSLQWNEEMSSVQHQYKPPSHTVRFPSVSSAFHPDITEGSTSSRSAVSVYTRDVEQKQSGIMAERDPRKRGTSLVKFEEQRPRTKVHSAPPDGAVEYPSPTLVEYPSDWKIPTLPEPIQATGLPLKSDYPKSRQHLQCMDRPLTPVALAAGRLTIRQLWVQDPSEADHFPPLRTDITLIRPIYLSGIDMVRLCNIYTALKVT
ncbi:hypothetical protein HDU93_005267 [Gonapodya sp. JEL0774]|nr:hypothetical protein HDU93_005267 [Gonapodya sp. JEL0774]